MTVELNKTYRAPKTAAREEAQRLRAGEAPRNLEYVSEFDAEKHVTEHGQRVIETKPSRFANLAVLIDKVGDKAFVGEGVNVRLPALAKLRDRKDKMFPEPTIKDELLQLNEDMQDMDLTAEVDAVISDPTNKHFVDAYEEIFLDILTDPDADSPFYFDIHDPKKYPESVADLRSRINLANSYESYVAGFALVKWGLEKAPESLVTSEENRQYLISLIPFFSNMSELEINHLDKYVSSWADRSANIEEAGLDIKQDGRGAHMFYLTERKKRPEKTLGKPVGCPAGFTFDSVAVSGIAHTQAQNSVVERMLTAYVNEAYDRGLLE